MIIQGNQWAQWSVQVSCFGDFSSTDACLLRKCIDFDPSFLFKGNFCLDKASFHCCNRKLFQEWSDVSWSGLIFACLPASHKKKRKSWQGTPRTKCGIVLCFNDLMFHGSPGQALFCLSASRKHLPWDFYGGYQRFMCHIGWCSDAARFTNKMIGKTIESRENERLSDD